MELVKRPRRFKLVSLWLLLVGKNIWVTESVISIQDSHIINSKSKSAEIVDKTASSLGDVSNLLSMDDDIFTTSEFEDGYIDDEIDPALKEILDR